MTNTRTVKPFNPLETSLAVDPFSFLTDLFTFFLQGLFENECFRGTGMHYIGDQDGATEDSELIITAEKPMVEHLDKRPHIVVVLGAGQWANISLDQLQGMTFATGQRTHTDLYSSTVAYHCQAKGGLQARRLAWFASFYTIVLRRILMRQGELHHVAPNLSVSAETGPTAFSGKRVETETVSVVVTVPFFWQPQWRITPPSETLQNVGVSLNLKELGVPLTPSGRPAYSIPIDQYQERPVVLTQSIEV